MARRDSTRVAAVIVGLLVLLGQGEPRAQEPPPCERTPEHRIPFTDPGGIGLYDGTNERPAAHTAAGIAAGLRVQDNPGRPIGFIGIGQSVTKTRFKQLMDQNNKGRFGNIVMINCARNGNTAETWSHPNLAPWGQCDQLIAEAGLLPTDIRVVYMEFTRNHPAPPQTEAEFEAVLYQEWTQITTIARQRYPFLEQGLVSGRTSGGWDQNFYNGEPYAYATNLVARRLVLDSIAGTNPLWIDWGSGVPDVPGGPPPTLYLWSNTDTPRQWDGYHVTCDPLPLKNGVPTFANGDVIDDMIHQTKKGRIKEGGRMQATLDTDPATAWWRQ